MGHEHQQAADAGDAAALGLEHESRACRVVDNVDDALERIEPLERAGGIGTVGEHAGGRAVDEQCGIGLLRDVVVVNLARATHGHNDGAQISQHHTCRGAGATGGTEHEGLLAGNLYAQLLDQTLKTKVVGVVAAQAAVGQARDGVDVTQAAGYIAHAGEIIRRGGLVAFPTETVYGLGANALDADAVRSVYEAKGRPSDNPMIVHIAEMGQLADVASEIPAVAVPLIQAYWPGPITFIMKKAEGVPMVTTGGFRMPLSEAARDLIRAAERPIAAPSANRSGRPSPTRYEDVLEDMDGRIDAVLLGEDCEVGIESTVLDLTGEVPMILRPGYITKEMLEFTLGSEVKYDPALFVDPMHRSEGEEFHPKAPGMKYRHYAPKAEVKIIEGDDDAAVEREIEEQLRLCKYARQKAVALNYGRDSKAAAKDFFARLRELDREDVDVILVRALPEEELGFSVMNRMLKSAGYDVIHV